MLMVLSPFNILAHTKVTQFEATDTARYALCTSTWQQKYSHGRLCNWIAFCQYKYVI